MEGKMSGYINPGFSDEAKDDKENLQKQATNRPGNTSANTSSLLTKSPTALNGALSKDSNEIEMNNADMPHASGVNQYQRRTSVADIAIAFATSSMNPGGSREHKYRGKMSLSYWQRSYRFIHPFGHTTSILDEILGSGYMEDGERTSSSSPAKLIIWVIFVCFIVGMAGAIILGAETKKTSEDTESTYSNVSDVISG